MKKLLKPLIITLAMLMLAGNLALNIREALLTHNRDRVEFMALKTFSKHHRMILSEIRTNQCDCSK